MGDAQPVAAVIAPQSPRAGRPAGTENASARPAPWCHTARGSTTPLPFPTPDPRAHYFVTQYADMHALVGDLVIPDGVPEAAATVLHTSRELLRHAYYVYEFSTVAVTQSLIAVEIVLRDRLAAEEKKSLHDIIKEAAAAGLLTPEQVDMLHTGRKIRNGLAHGKTTHAAMPWAMAVPMVRTSFTLIGEVCAAVPAAADPAAKGEQTSPVL